MVKSLDNAATPPRVRDFVHEAHTSVQAVPNSAILMASLKVVEAELMERRLIAGETAMPLWFLAETERNVFLWRSGYSLDEAELFEFWIDLPALIRKRLSQIERPIGGTNPFINPVWGEEVFDAESADRETLYLTGLQEALPELLPHANALSHVNSIIYREMVGATEESLKIVVLPNR